MKQFKFWLVVIMAVSCSHSFLLGQSNTRINWYFGSNTNSIRFQRPDLNAEQITIPNSLGFGGGAVATDPIKGELFFYTDGINVYNKEHTLLNGGNPLTGSTTRNQAVAISHDPQDADGSVILIFTVNNAGNIFMNQYDKSANATFPFPGEGDLVAPFNSTANLPAGTLSEGMIIVPNDDLSGFWLITHNTGANSFNITEISSTGITTPITPTTIAGAPTSVSNFAYHPETNRISASPADPTEDIFILNIDPATGALTSAGFDLSSLPNGAIYDTEFSITGDTLYMSGDLGEAVHELSRIDITSPAAREIVLTNDIGSSFGLEIAPDSSIYHIYQAQSDGQFQVGRIEDPNNPDIAQTLYNPQPFGDLGFQARQFPAFLPPYNLLNNPDFEFSGTCANAPTYFFPRVTPDIESVTWDFGDGTGTSNAISPQYTYTEAGTYTVEMTVMLNGIPESISHDITITEFELTLQIEPQQEYWCDFPVTYTATAQGANASGATIRWSNQTAAEANAVTQIEEPGTYYVVATDPTSGCEAYMEQQVFEYGTTNSYAFVWYFGNNAGLDFNPQFDIDHPDFQSIQPVDLGGPDFNGGNQMTSPAGTAIYCDPNGDPLLYSDGEEVYNRANTLLTSDLGGNENATQSILITQNPDDATLYYLFFTQEIPDPSGGASYEFAYAIFDLKKRDGDGDLIKDGSDNVITTTLFNCNTERITGDANWVIIHEYGNNNFRAYPIGADGIGAPVVSNTGKNHPFTNTSGKGYMKLSGDRIAVALSESNTQNFVELFDFDNTTGAITHNATLDLSSETGQVYGVEFSPDNEKVFATFQNAGGGTKIFWWDLIDNTVDPSEPFDEAGINASRVLIVDEGATLGAMQQGPNGTLYIANDGATTLASISSPNTEPITATPDTEVNYNLATPDFPNVGSGATSTLGLPNFINFQGSPTPSAGLSVNDLCIGEPLTLTVTNPLQDPVEEVEDYLIHIYDDAGTRLAQSPRLDFNNPSWTFNATQTSGEYEAHFFTLNACGLPDPDPQVLPFTISPEPSFTIDQIQDVTGACGNANGSFRVNFTETGDFTYTVSGPVPTPETGVTNRPFTVNNLSAGGYTVTITNTATGCDFSQSTAISDPATFQMDITPNTAECDGSNGNLSIELLNGPPNYPVTYTVIDEATRNVVATGQDDNTDADNTFEVAVPAGTYTINITEGGASPCTISESGILVDTPPQAALTIPTDVAVCDETQARIPISTNASTLSVSGPDPQALFEGDSILVVNVEGTYVITAGSDDPGSTLCANPQSVGVSFANSNENPFEPRYVICPDDPVQANNQVVLYPGTGYVSVDYFDMNGNPITTGSPPSVFEFSGDSLIVKVAEPVTVELTNPFGCVTTAEIDIIEDCRARVNAPNAFKPSSGITENQTWSIFPIFIANEDFQILIFNRWGEMVFQSSDLVFMTNTGWNGGYDNDLGRPLPGGTYAYKVQYKSSVEDNPELQESRGGITLVR